MLLGLKLETPWLRCLFNITKWTWLPGSPRIPQSSPVTGSFWLTLPASYPKLLQPRAWATLLPDALPYIIQPFWVPFSSTLYTPDSPLSPPSSPHWAWLKVTFSLASPWRLCLCLCSPSYKQLQTVSSTNHTYALSFLFYFFFFIQQFLFFLSPSIVPCAVYSFIQQTFSFTQRTSNCKVQQSFKKFWNKHYLFQVSQQSDLTFTPQVLH